jgi:type I restriction enzyme M protein
MTERKKKSGEPEPAKLTPSLEEGMITDFITGQPVKETEKELVRQEVARQLIFEYQIAPESMEADFPVKVDSKRKKLDIAIFEAGKEHLPSNLQRAVICRPLPKAGKKSVVKIRDFAQAEKDLDEIKEILIAVEGCDWGLWTNGLERFFLHKEKRRFEVRFAPHGDWPMADGSMSTPDMHAESYTRPGDENALRRAFQRCHNFIHGNEGMPKDAAFWQFLYLIFAKMYDERTNRGKDRKFFAHATEPFSEEGRMAIRNRIRPLFEAVKKQYSGSGLFRPGDEITLSDRALAYMVMELARYNLSRSDVDAKGAAYQEIVGANLRGDRGQYFTPRRAVNLIVRILDPKEHEKVFDPACGTGGFLVGTLAHFLRRFKSEYKRDIGDKTQEDISDRLRDYANKCLFGADFDPFLVRASTMNVLMAADTEGHIFHMDSLAFPRSHLPGNDLAKKYVAFGTVDVLMTNPPFGSEIPITEPAILETHQLARRWSRGEGNSWIEQTTTQNAVAPEILFIEQSIKWLRPGGRMGIVLPNGILGNPGDEYIRRWILRHCWVLACVEVPVEAFIVEANVGILTSLLFLKKKSEDEMDAEAQGHVKEYPIFMAVAEKAGVDRRGNALYKRNPDGTEKMVTHISEEKVKTNGNFEVRQRKIVGPEIDDDFPAVGDAYEEFRKKHPEPGA